MKLLFRGEREAWNIIKRKYDVKSPAIGSAHVGSILEIGAKIEIMILSTVNMPFS